MKKLTVVLPFLNEEQEPVITINSMLETADPSQFDVLAIDDCSDPKKKPDLSKFDNVRLIRNEPRIGSGASKHLGGTLVETPYMLILDAHMRFKKDHWLEKMVDCLDREPNTLWCYACLGMDKKQQDINKPNGKYYGANILLVDKDAMKDRPAREVFEPKWAQKQKEGEYEIPCILGANYAISKTWFDHIHGMKGLQMWGSEEPFISMKSWMAGGSCKVRTDVEIGHLFRDNAPYSTPIYQLVYNKMFIFETIFPTEIGKKLLAKLPKDSSYDYAVKEMRKNIDFIVREREYYQGIFTHSFYEVCDKLHIDYSLL